MATDVHETFQFHSPLSDVTRSEVPFWWMIAPKQSRAQATRIYKKQTTAVAKTRFVPLKTRKWDARVKRVSCATAALENVFVSNH